MTLADRIAEMRITRLKTQLLFWRQKATEAEDPKSRTFIELEASVVEAKIREAQDERKA